MSLQAIFICHALPKYRCMGNTEHDCAKVYSLGINNIKFVCEEHLPTSAWNDVELYYYDERSNNYYTIEHLSIWSVINQTDRTTTNRVLTEFSKKKI